MMNEKGIRMMKKWMSVMLLLALLLAPCAAWAADYAATIGSKGYVTLDEAIDAGKGKTIVLRKNNTIAAYKELTKKGNITIDLNGYQINQALVLQGNTALKIMDSKGGGKLYTGADSGTTYAISVENGASVSIVSGHVYRDSTPVYVKNGGSVSVSGGKVEGGSRFEAIEALGGSIVNISGGEVIGGLAGINSSGVVYVTGGKIQGGQGEYDCAVNIANDGKLNVSGGEFTGGKAIWMEKADQVSFSGSGYSLNGNTAELALTPTDGKTLALSDVACEGWRIYAYINDLPAQSVSLPDGLSLLYNNAVADTIPSGKVGMIGRAQKATFEVTAAASPAAGGTASGGGTYDHGETVTLTATANKKYTFKNWTKDGEVVSTNPTYTFTAAEGGTYTANFEKDKPVTYKVQVKADPNKGGTVSGGGDYQEGTTATLEATANPGYTFVNWTKDGEEVSTNPTYTFTATEKATYTAIFAEDTYTVTVAAEPTVGGQVSRDKESYTYGKNATLEATANPGYTFVNWTKDGEVVSTDAKFKPAVTANAAYTANFALNSYTITAAANPAEGGTVSGGGTYDHGESVTLTATAKTGYSFVNWTKGGEVVSTSAEYTFTAAENAELVANFELNSYTITAAANPAAGGTVTGGGTVKHGAGVTLTATANDGYSFVNWTKGGEVVSTDAAYTFTAEADAELVANFVEDKPAEYTVTAMPNMTEGGTVTGGGTYAAGTTATLTAAANEGFVFEKWQKNDADVSTDNPYTVTVTENAAYTAVFTKVLPGPDPEPTLYTVTAAASPVEGGTIAGLSEDGRYEENAAVTLTATANDGYAFVNWTKGGEVVSTDAAYAFTVTADANLVANFEANEPEPEAQYKPFDGDLTNDCVTDALRSKNITTAEDIRQKMMAAFTEMGMISGNVAHYDITLMVSMDGGKTWEPAAEIPEGGYVAEIPLPSGSDPLLHNFIVLHMFAQGERAGEVERPAFEIADGKLFIHMTSFSPVSVAWQDKNLQAAGDAAQDLPQTGDASSLGLWTALLLGTAGLAALRKKRREA